jgi:hypothetical protein
VLKEPVLERLRAALAARMEAMVVGDGMHAETQMGPCINAQRTALAQVCRGAVPCMNCRHVVPRTLSVPRAMHALQACHAAQRSLRLKAP